MADAIEEQRAHAAGPRPAWTYWRFAKEASARKARRIFLWLAAPHFHNNQPKTVFIACVVMNARFRSSAAASVETPDNFCCSSIQGVIERLEADKRRFAAVVSANGGVAPLADGEEAPLCGVITGDAYMPPNFWVYRVSLPHQPYPFHTHNTPIICCFPCRIRVQNCGFCTLIFRGTAPGAHLRYFGVCQGAGVRRHLQRLPQERQHHPGRGLQRPDLPALDRFQYPRSGTKPTASPFPIVFPISPPFDLIFFDKASVCVITTSRVCAGRFASQGASVP